MLGPIDYCLRIELKQANLLKNCDTEQCTLTPVFLKLPALPYNNPDHFEKRNETKLVLTKLNLLKVQYMCWILLQTKHFSRDNERNS